MGLRFSDMQDKIDLVLSHVQAGTQQNVSRTEDGGGEDNVHFKAKWCQTK